ncbi:hypothetical protein BDL97_06G074200 [Sphagnum fallax]|nr:hypothetical protein BDL97_06G074200 [Sphagnum fallax]
MEAPSLLQQQAYPLMHSQLHSQLHFQQQQEAQYQQQVQQDSFGTPISQPLPSNVFSSGVPVLSGHKRDNSGTPVTQPSQDAADGGMFVKLFVGSVPRTISEEEVRPMFAEHGHVLEVAIIKDKRTGIQQGCCFIKYSTVEEAERAIRALNNQRTLPGGTAPVQVRYADGERERLGAVEHKLFVGSLNRQALEKEIEEIFSPYGRVDDVYIMRDEQKQSRGCAFIKYPQREMAQAAINALNGLYTMPGCDQPLAVRFADPKRPKGVDARVGGPGFGGPGFSPQLGQVPGGLRTMPQPQVGYSAAQGSPMGWRPMGGPGLGTPPQAGPSPYGALVSLRGGPATGVPHIGGMMNGHLHTIVPGQMPAPGMLPQQQVPQQPYVVQPPPQLQPQQQQQQQAYVQIPPSYQQPQAYGQMQVPAMQPQLQSQQQQPQQQIVVQLQPQQQQPPLQAVPKQTVHSQSLQPSQGQSQPQPLPQMYYQIPLVQPIQQPTWIVPVQQAQTVMAVTALSSPAAPATCEWTEHTSPEGYKYYYNINTGESKWEKPDELIAAEQQQRQIPVVTQQYSGSAVLSQHPVQVMNYGHAQPSIALVEQPRQQGPPGANLFVFRIPDDFTDENLKETFARFGNVISARVGVERESGRNRGFGFVSYDSAAAAESAIQGLNNVPVGGRRLKVERKRGEENGVQGYQQQPY